MIAAGKLKLRIEHTYKLEEAAKAHRELEARKTTGKLLLTRRAIARSLEG
jgi:NADPH2:quinone reductase